MANTMASITVDIMRSKVIIGKRLKGYKVRGRHER